MMRGHNFSWRKAIAVTYHHPTLIHCLRCQLCEPLLAVCATRANMVLTHFLISPPRSCKQHRVIVKGCRLPTPTASQRRKRAASPNAAETASDLTDLLILEQLLTNVGFSNIL